MSRTERNRYRDTQLPYLFRNPNGNPRRNMRFNADRQSETPSDIGRAVRKYDRAQRRNAMQRGDYDLAAAKTSRAAQREHMSYADY